MKVYRDVLTRSLDVDIPLLIITQRQNHFPTNSGSVSPRLLFGYVNSSLKSKKMDSFVG